MANSIATVGLFLIGIFSIVHGSNDEVLSSVLVGQISNGIKEFHSVVNTMEKLTTDKMMISGIQHLSQFLGVTGGIISLSLLFVPQETPELQYMKKSFSEVNMKLDRITNKLDNIKDMIVLETQRVEYIDAASKILFAYEQLTKHYLEDMAAVTCSSKKDCLRQRLGKSESYLTTFNVKASLFKILSGTVKYTSVFGEPLLELIKKTFKCDIKKIYNFANGVIKLAFKAQQVVLAYEKLSGTNTSIALALKKWLEYIYNVRNKVEEVKYDCYSNIHKYIKNNVENMNYQKEMSSNKDAAVSMKNELDKKYPWLYWVVFSYGAYGEEEHFGTNFGNFTNMPLRKEDSKRVLRVIPQDKGKYSSQRQELSSCLKRIAANTVFRFYSINAKRIYKKFKEELEKTPVWNKLSSFVVLARYTDLHVAVDSGHSLHFYDEVLSLRFPPTFSFLKNTREVRFLASFKSEEQISGVSCTKSCNNSGTCLILPYTSTSYCSCYAFYQGENCEKHDKINLATSVEKMLAVTARIPKLTDVYFELLDMQDLIGTSFGKIGDSIAALDRRLQEKFDALNEKIVNEFRWANLVTIYSQPIRDLLYYLYKFQTLNSTIASYTKDISDLAKTVIEIKHGENWIHELNKLIVGRKHFGLLQHKPFIFFLMDKHKDIACSMKYKDTLDTAWRRIMVLQNQVYIMRAQAMSILGKPLDKILQNYEEKVSNQIAFMNNSTCELTVPGSTNLNCTGGFYAYPGFKVTNRCKPDHYLVGDSLISCDRGSSACHPCNCDPRGSTSNECSDQTGKCYCKSPYVGLKCQYCLSPNFYCTETDKCIPDSYRCNYKNDCGDFQDENDCDERCHSKDTGSLIYGLPNRLNCGNDFLNTFHLQSHGGYFMFHYKCCKPLRDVIRGFRRVSNSYYYMPSDQAYTGNVSCGPNGIIRDFWLSAEKYDGNYCGDLVTSNNQLRLSCYDKMIYVSYPKRHGTNFNEIACKSRYFMQSIRYYFSSIVGVLTPIITFSIKCCLIIPA